MKFVIYGVLFLVCIGAAIFYLGPKEPITGPFTYDSAAISGDVDGYLYRSEQTVPNLVRGAQKHVQWYDPARRNRTEWAVVYIHGFSATSFEVRPLPKLVADALEGNLYYTRLKGHGRDGAAMLEGSVPAWMNDVAEALEIGRRIGDKVLVIGTSTGGSLSALAAFDNRLKDKVDALAFISPNFGVKAGGARLLTLPFARSFVPLIAGKTRSFTPHNEEHGRRWTTSYPTRALLPMAAAVKAASGLPFEQAEVPALFVFADADQVVDATRTREVAARWGASVSLYPVAMKKEDDPSSHVIAGDIMSPGQTYPIAERILLWVTGLKFEN
ncbi:alpha/beta hydrolase [Algicella marina]|nr:alpha/beta fold hydrolase [Algicella marina]